jgi:hypothetical protein
MAVCWLSARTCNRRFSELRHGHPPPETFRRLSLWPIRLLVFYPARVRATIPVISLAKSGFS